MLLVTAPVAAQDLSTAIDSIMSEWDRPDAPGASVAVMHQDSVVHAKGYGIANLEYDAKNTEETVFMVASVSKQFTAFAIAMLVADGSIALDDSIRKYVPEMHSFETPITVRHLVHHTSGLRDEFGLLGMAGYRMDDVISKDTILHLLYRQRALNFAPGAEYSYCNSGYTLMAEIVERVTGQTFREWTTENIFAPLGMEDSHFRDDHTTVIPGRAQGYLTTDSTFKAQTVAYSSVGASGLYTTASDMVKWMRNFETGTVGGKEVLELIQQRGVLSDGDTLSYAFGLIHDTVHGARRIGHSGSHRGFLTYAGRFPDHDLAVIVLGNFEEFSPATVAVSIADLFLPDASERFAEYAGTYHSEELAHTVQILIEGDKLVFVNRHGERTVYAETGEDAFTSDLWFMPTMEFTRTDGEVDGFTTSNRRTRDVAFARQ